VPLNYGDHCSTSNECDQKYGTECSNGLCTCPITHYYDKPNCGKLKKFNFDNNLKRKLLKF
jgi:hypothetical protein